MTYIQNLDTKTTCFTTITPPSNMDFSVEFNFKRNGEDYQFCETPGIYQILALPSTYDADNTSDDTGYTWDSFVPHNRFNALFDKVEVKGGKITLHCVATEKWSGTLWIAKTQEAINQSPTQAEELLPSMAWPTKYFPVNFNLDFNDACNMKADGASLAEMGETLF